MGIKKMAYKDPLQELMASTKSLKNTIFDYSLLKKTKKAFSPVKEPVKNKISVGSGAEEKDEDKAAIFNSNKGKSNEQNEAAKEPDGVSPTRVEKVEEIQFRSPFRSPSKAKRSSSVGKSSPVKVPDFFAKLEKKHKKEIMELEAEKNELEGKNRRHKEQLEREEKEHEMSLQEENDKLVELEERRKQTEKAAKGFVEVEENNKETADYASNYSENVIIDDARDGAKDNVKNGAKNESKYSSNSLLEDSYVDLLKESFNSREEGFEVDFDKIFETKASTPEELPNIISEDSKQNPGAASDFTPLALLDTSAPPKKITPKVETKPNTDTTSASECISNDGVNLVSPRSPSEKAKPADGGTGEMVAESSFGADRIDRIDRIDTIDKIDNHAPIQNETGQKSTKTKDLVSNEGGTETEIEIKETELQSNNSDDDASVKVRGATDNTNIEADKLEPVISDTDKDIIKDTETIEAKEAKEGAANLVKIATTESPKSKEMKSRAGRLSTSSNSPKKNFFGILPSGLLPKNHSNSHTLPRDNASNCKVDPKVQQRINHKEQKNRAKIAALKKKTELQMRTIEESYNAKIANLQKQIAAIDASMSKNENKANEAIDEAYSKHVENTKKLNEQHEETKNKIYEENELRIKQKKGEIEQTQKNQIGLENELKALEIKEAESNKNLESIKFEIAELKQKIIFEKEKQEELTKVKQEKIAVIKDLVSLKRKLLEKLKEANKTNEQFCISIHPEEQEEYVRKVNNLNKSIARITEELDHTIQNSKDSSNRQTDLESSLVNREYDEYKALEYKTELQSLHEKATSKSKIQLDNLRHQKEELKDLSKEKNEEDDSSKKKQADILQKIEEARVKREALTKELKEADTDLFETIERESFIEVEVDSLH